MPALRRIRGRSGSAYIIACALVCALFLVFYAVYMFAGTVSAVSETARCARMTLERTVTANAPVIYGSVKEGGSAGGILDRDGYASLFAAICSLEKEGDVLVRRSSSGEETYSTDIPEIFFYGDGEELDAVAEFTVSVRIFGNFRASVPVRVRAAMTSKDG